MDPQIVLDGIANLLSAGFWEGIACIGSIIALFIIVVQVYTSRKVAAADFLLKLQRQFYSKRMLESRRKIMEAIKKDPDNFEGIDAAKDVLEFFGNVGGLVKKSVIDVELAWGAFSYWILRYWKAVQNYVRDYRKREDDPLYYSRFENLYNRMLCVEERKTGKKFEPTEDQMQRFIDEEIRL